MVWCQVLPLRERTGMRHVFSRWGRGVALDILIVSLCVHQPLWLTESLLTAPPALERLTNA